MASSPPPPIREVDKLTNQIFSILENKFLFGHHTHFAAAPTGKIRILSIDSGGEGILAATALLHLQTILRRKSGNPSAHISDFFDVVTGAGEGGILAGLLFTRGKNVRRDPMFSGEEALKFIVHNRRELSRYPSTSVGVFGRRKKAKVLDGVFGEATLRDTVKAVLIPCFDLRSGAPFLFSRADAVEMEGCDFRMAGVCGATMAGGRAVELKSTDGKKRIVAVGGGVGGMSNPTAAAITHVLNNKQDFPECKGVEDLLVVSLGNGHVNSSSKLSSSTPDAFLKIAADGAYEEKLPRATETCTGHP